MEVNFLKTIFFVFILYTISDSVQSIHTLNSITLTHHTLDPCLINLMNYLFQHYNTLQHPLILLKPTNDRSNIHFASFIQQISHQTDPWPYFIYDTLDVENINSDSNLIMFISSPSEITDDVVKKLKYSHTKIHIIFWDVVTAPSYLFQPKIERIFNMFPVEEFSYVIIFGRRNSKYATWRIFTAADQNCHQTINHRLIGFCQFNGSHSDQLNDLGLNKRKNCTFNVLATEYEPFTYFDREKGFHTGIDISLVNVIAEKLGVKVNFIYHELYGNAEVIANRYAI